MDNFQKINPIKDFDSFDSLINWDGGHTFFLVEVQFSNEKNIFGKWSIYSNMVIIIFPAMNKKR